MILESMGGCKLVDEKDWQNGQDVRNSSFPSIPIYGGERLGRRELE